MADCELIEKCLFFHDKMAKMPTTANMMKLSYCMGSSDECARYIVFKEHGREKVPHDLYPTEVARVAKLTT